ncbi:hypothetical protein EES43_09905 [Streptomyces sp. ADI96-02]|uniref:DUF6339 family protein n=1 Tax=unclassified Streptomyces TaxID=2593676 RepID=UPI000F558E92|nr:DUF6339 family protein [Streptomyces sp. ADI96-02]RPK64346.1 hypothetical protein EES43_09905 [Streptomyces sp. ADI96-02]
MTDKPNFHPERLALLADLNAAQYLTEGLLTGKEDVPAIALNRITEPLPYEGESRAELDPVRALIDDAMYEFRDDRPTTADAWLAPRLHAALRLTRREAADRRFWNYLALGVAPDYVVWRHLSEPRKKQEESSGPPKVAVDRFRGPAYKQAFARLWWTAELFRNGPDYAPVVTVCGNQDMLNTALRMDVIDHRPTAQAMVRLLERGTVTTGREANALAAAVNASAATLMYDVLAPDAERDGRPSLEWVESAESAPAVPRRDLPVGPYEEKAPERSVDALVDHFAELFAGAPVRGRTGTEEETGGEV